MRRALYAGCFRALVILADQCVELRAELRVQAAMRRGRQLRKDSDDVSDAAVLDPGAVVNPAAIDAAFGCHHGERREQTGGAAAPEGGLYSSGRCVVNQASLRKQRKVSCGGERSRVVDPRCFYGTRPATHVA